MLADLVRRKILPDDEILLKEIEEAALQPDSFLAVINFLKPGYELVGPTCHAVTGYSNEAFLKGGPEFSFSILTPETSLASVQGLVSFSLEAKAPGFDPRTIRIHEQLSDMRTGFGYTKTLMILGLPLIYTHDSETESGIVLHAEVKGETINECRQRLRRIKERHNIVYQHTPLQIKPESLQKLFIQKRPQQKLTKREEEILKLIAEGLTSAQIATALFIEENTVETHRKNLLSKFEAKNIAELIKKASKLYWLE